MKEQTSAETLLTATQNLSKSTDHLAHKVEGIKEQRKGLTILMSLTCVILIVQSVYAAIAFQRISNTDAVATRLTGPEIVEQQRLRADYRADKTIFCINSYAAALNDENARYDSRCPKEYPGIPVD